MVFPNVQVIVQVPGKLNEERAAYLRDEVHKAVAAAVQAEVATLMAAATGESKYSDVTDMKLFKIEVSIRVDRVISQQFLKFIVDNALKEVLGDLGREWMMESMETAMDAVSDVMDKARDTMDRVWENVTQSLARALDSAARAVGGDKPNDKNGPRSV